MSECSAQDMKGTETVTRTNLCVETSVLLLFASLDVRDCGCTVEL